MCYLEIGAGLRGRRLRLYSQRFLNHLKNLAKTRTHGGVLQFNEIQSRKIKQQKQKVSEGMFKPMHQLSSE